VLAVDGLQAGGKSSGKARRLARDCRRFDFEEFNLRIVRLFFVL
jgi:hypothetical protein